MCTFACEGHFGFCIACMLQGGGAEVAQGRWAQQSTPCQKGGCRTMLSCLLLLHSTTTSHMYTPRFGSVYMSLVRVYLLRR